MLDPTDNKLYRGKGLQLHHVCFAITWVTSRVHHLQIRYLCRGNALDRMTEIMRLADVELAAQVSTSKFSAALAAEPILPGDFGEVRTTRTSCSVKLLCSINTMPQSQAKRWLHAAVPDLPALQPLQCLHWQRLRRL